MADSDNEDILYAHDLGRNLIGGKRVKNMDDVMNGGKKDKRKLRKTLALCMAFLCLGLCLSILGPTLLSLTDHLHTTVPKISMVFAGRSVGYLSGAILGGMLFEAFNPLFLLAIVLLLCGIGITVAPFAATVLALGVCISSVGISMGVLDTGANLVCLRMWGKKRSGTMLQALHFSFALGAFFAPLLASPFLVDTSTTGNMVETTSTLVPPTLNVAMTDAIHTLGNEKFNSGKPNDFDVKSDDGSTGVKSDDGSTGVKSDNGSTDVKSDDVSTDVKSDDGSTDVKSDDGSTDVKSDDVSIDVKSDDGSTGVKSDDDSTDVKSDDGTSNNNPNDIKPGTTKNKRDGRSTDDKSDDGTSDDKSDDGGTVVKSNGVNTDVKSDGSSDVNSDDGSTDEKSDDGSTDEKSNDGSTDERSDNGSTDEKSDNGSNDVKSDNGSTSVKSDDSSTDVKSVGGSTDVKSDNVSNAVKSDDGSTDEKSDDGSTDEKSDNGSTDEKSDDGSTNEKSDNGSTDEKSDDGSTDEKSDGSTDEKSDNGSTDEKSDDGSTDEKSDDGSTDEKSDDGSTDEKSDDGSTDEKSDDGNTDEKSDDGSTVEKSDDGSTDEKSDDGSTDEMSDDGSTDEKSDDGSSDEKSHDGSTDEKSDDGSTDEKSDDGSTDEKSDDGSTDEKSDDGSTDEKSDDGSTDEKSDDGSTDEKSDDDITDEKSDDGSTDEKSDDGSTDVKSDDGSTDVKSDDGSTDEKSDDGSTDEKSDGSTDEKSNNGSTDEKSDNSSTNENDGESKNANVISSNESTSSPQHQVPRFAMPYIIIGVFVLITSVLFFYFLFTKPKNEPKYVASEDSGAVSDKDNFPFRTRVLLLLFCFYFLYVGGEVAYGSFVPMFASKSPHQFGQDRASHVAALFWGTFTFGRGLAICLASVISPLKMVIADMVGCVTTSVFLTLFADTNENVLWLGSAFLGLSMASLFPTGIAWLETYTRVTGNTASFLVVGSALGEMCVPVVIGYLFEDKIGPMVLMYWMLATSALSALIFAYVMWLMMENGKEKESLPAEKSPALDLLHSVEEAFPGEEFFSNGTSSNKQMSKPLVPPILKKKDHKE